MDSLICARLLQGIGAAGRQSVGVIIVLDLTTPDSRGLWLGFFNCASAIGLAIGPVLGAVISVDANWRWIFWITLILIGITLIIGATSLRYPVPHRKQSVGLLAQLREVDYIGSLLIVAVSSMICIAIEMGNKMFPWNVRPHPRHVLFPLTNSLLPSHLLLSLYSSSEVSLYLSLLSTSLI